MKTNLIFYGTGGADGIPNPFCRCEICEHARSTGGRDRRRRSALRIGDELMMDFGPDMAAAAFDFGDLFDIEHVVISHTHEDHFYYALIETRVFAKNSGAAPLNIYFTGDAFNIVDTIRSSRAFMGGKLKRYEDRGIVKFHQLEYGQPARVGNTAVTPFKGNHTGNLGESSANYLITLEDGRNLYYAVDTGYFLPETIDLLADTHIDILIAECTYGNRSDRGEKPDFHLDLKNCILLFDTLYVRKIIRDSCRIYLTHISHHNTAPHSELEAMAGELKKPYDITVAYDGMKISPRRTR